MNKNFALTLILLLIGLAQTSQATQCNLDEVVGKIENYSNIPNKDLVVELEYYAPKDSFRELLWQRSEHQYTEKVNIKINDDGTFVIPKLKISNVKEMLYIFPDFYKNGGTTKLDLTGMVNFGPFTYMPSATYFSCKSWFPSTYNKIYKDSFSKLALKSLDNTKIKIVTSNNQTVREFIENYFQKYYPQYLDKEKFYYELKFHDSLYLKASASTSGEEFVGYNNLGNVLDEFQWQGIPKCNDYDLCLATSTIPESLEKNEFEINLGEGYLNNPSIYLVPINLIQDKVRIELLVRPHVQVFQLGSPHIVDQFNVYIDPVTFQHEFQVNANDDSLGKTYKIILSLPLL